MSNSPKSHNKGLSQYLQSQTMLLYFQSNNLIGTVQPHFPTVMCPTECMDMLKICTQYVHVQMSDDQYIHVYCK